MLAFGLIGAGTATLIPAALHAADQLPGLPASAALTTVSWLQRTVGLASPPLIGLIADHASLRAALLVVPVAAAIAALLAGRLTGPGQVTLG